MCNKATELDEWYFVESIEAVHGWKDDSIIVHCESTCGRKLQFDAAVDKYKPFDKLMVFVQKIVDDE